MVAHKYPTDEEVAHELIRHKGKLSLTGKALGCNSYYVRSRIEANPEVMSAYLHARDIIVDMAEQVIFNQLYRGSERAAMFVLTTLGKDRGYVTRNELTGANGAVLEVTLNMGKNEINMAEDVEELDGDDYEGEIIDGNATISTAEAAARLKVNYTRPPLYPKQYDAIFTSSRLNCIEAATKRQDLRTLIWLFELALFGVNRGIYWWIAPIYPQSKIAFLRLINALHDSPIVESINRSEMVITLINSATIHFKSGDRPDGLYGEDVNGAVIDEASRVREEAFVATRSTLTATRGPILCIGNVRGKKNWFYKLCRRIFLKNLKNASYSKLTAMDAARAGVIEWEELREAERLLPSDVYRELYLAEATEEGANPFGTDNIESCTMENMSTLDPICFGIDLAKSHDYTVIIGLDKSGQVSYFDRFQRHWTKTVQDIIKLPDIPMMIDNTGVGNAPVEYIQADRKPGTVFDFTFTKNSKQPLMEELGLTIASQNIWYPDGIIRTELDDFEFEYTRTGVLYSAPSGYYDDCVIALALANRMRKEID